MLALLLPCDFDSAKTRARYFRDCPHFIGKIILTKRVVWFQRSDGIREAPKENSAWFLWRRCVLRVRRSPVILYAPTDDRPSLQSALDCALHRGDELRVHLEQCRA
jgi:hypothetical protein